VSRDLALMGALTGLVSLLIKKILCGVGRIDLPAGVVLVAYGGLSLTVLGFVNLATLRQHFVSAW